MTIRLLPSFAVVSIFLSSCSAGGEVEVGTVRWERDFEGALEVSATTGEPVFALFQEVPGCAGCQKFGREVLSNARLVEAIESEFVPVLIYNNRGGKDAELLKRYREPAWNYQVVRFLNGAGEDMLPRRDRVWELGPLAERMVEALEAAARPVPEYLRLLALPGDGSEVEYAAFAMFCFWTGEMHLGRLDGVIETEAGWLEGREVTLVRYRRDILSFPDLVGKAAEVRCADKVYAATPAQLELLGPTRLKTGHLTVDYRKAGDSDQKRQIQGTRFAKLDLDPAQAAKVNAWARGNDGMAWRFLSPRQREALKSKRDGFRVGG